MFNLGSMMGQHCFWKDSYQEIGWCFWCLYPHEGDSVTGSFALIGGKTCQPEAQCWRNRWMH